MWSTPTAFTVFLHFSKPHQTPDLNRIFVIGEEYLVGAELEFPWYVQMGGMVRPQDS